MYRNIGFRNHQAIIRNGHKLTEIWKKDDSNALREMAASYQSALNTLDALFKAANIIANR